MKSTIIIIVFSVFCSIASAEVNIYGHWIESLNVTSEGQNPAKLPIQEFMLYSNGTFSVTWTPELSETYKDYSGTYSLLKSTNISFEVKGPKKAPKDFKGEGSFTVDLDGRLHLYSVNFGSPIESIDTAKIDEYIFTRHAHKKPYCKCRAPLSDRIFYSDLSSILVGDAVKFKGTNYTISSFVDNKAEMDKWKAKDCGLLLSNNNTSIYCLVREVINNNIVFVSRNTSSNKVQTTAQPQTQPQALPQAEPQAQPKIQPQANASDAVMDKLKNTIIPEIEVKDASVQSIISYLLNSADLATPQNNTKGSNQVSIAVVISTNVANKSVTMQVRQTSVFDALNLTAKMTNAKWKLKDGKILVFSSLSEE